MSARRRGVICPEAEHFQPDAVMARIRRPPFLVRFGLYAVLLCIATAAAWAWWARVDKVVRARGRVAMSDGPIVVQPLELGVIREILVSPGDRVRKGQTLALLDSTFTESDAAQLADRVAFLDARKERLERELREADSAAEFEPGENSGPEDDEPLHRERKEQFRSKVRSLDSRIRQLEQGVASLVKEQARLAEQTKVLIEIESMRRELYDRKVDSRLSYLLAKRERQEMSARYESAVERQAQAEQELNAARADRETFINAWKVEIAEEVERVGQERTQAAHQLDKASLRRDLVRLTAPADGVVQSVARYSAGSVAREAEQLMVIIPSEAGLEADVDVPAKDIGLIRVGRPVRVKLDAFPFQRYGVLVGEVRMISPDGALEGGQASSTAGQADGGDVVYRTRIKLSPGGLRNAPKDFRLIPGMTLTAEINLGERTVLSYLTDPLVRAMDESLREL